jgi:hypothetical protein
LDTEAFKKMERWRIFSMLNSFMKMMENIFCGVEVEKMSKSKFNTVNPMIW